MRENGMTNAQIAESLDVSVPTIHRYIGAMPKEMKRSKPDMAIVGRPIEVKHIIEKQDERLAINGMTFSMVGETVAFSVLLNDEKVEIAGDDFVGTVEIRKLDSMVRDLQMALNTIRMMRGLMNEKKGGATHEGHE